MWPSGTECIAKYNFHGTAEQDLPFSKGDVLTIVAVTKVKPPQDPNPPGGVARGAPRAHVRVPQVGSLQLGSRLGVPAWLRCPHGLGTGPGVGLINSRPR